VSEARYLQLLRLLLLLLPPPPPLLLPMTIHPMRPATPSSLVYSILVLPPVVK
jgi:hypothetical protein